jgi:hypothetical protein
MYEHCVDAYHHYIRLYMRNNYRMKLYKDLIERQGAWLSKSKVRELRKIADHLGKQARLNTRLSARVLKYKDLQVWGS